MTPLPSSAAVYIGLGDSAGRLHGSRSMWPWRSTTAFDVRPQGHLNTLGAKIKEHLLLLNLGTSR
ncbi:hypothetical protein E2562_031890 [Oryza meyeriana var. granulata]|uniref:Uncharacterized protein n=1 Tax=Oryza meyeriana var. granulata TaxID=110450 RepID=A0A6G1F086_9ORYZ|nr:hypothetical protein E2562_031890 [Oryza meyeriana var. granulata]